jgi:hypothetical protein
VSIQISKGTRVTNQITFIAKVLRLAEVGIGFFLPLLVAGPFVAIGLALGLIPLLLGGDLTMFSVSLCGLFGLLGLGGLFFGQDNMSRRRAELSTAGVFAGILSVTWILGRGSKDLERLDKGALLWAAVLLPPGILGLRRVILLWKNPPS